MKKFILPCAFVFVAGVSFGQTQNFQMYSLYMYSFTRFVQWPAEESQGDFEITVLGDSPVLTELKKMAEIKKASGRQIKVTKINSLADYKKSHILYLSSDWSAKFTEVAAKIGEDPVLLVTDQATANNKGCVNFVNNKEGKLAFELNQAAIGKHKLKVSAELSRLAIAN